MLINCLGPKKVKHLSRINAAHESMWLALDLISRMACRMAVALLLHCRVCL